MDFITNLPPSAGKTTILVVVDRLSKQVHFSPLTPNYTTVQVAETFVRVIIRLHGMPTTIVSNRDPLFTSLFFGKITL